MKNNEILSPGTSLITDRINRFLATPGYVMLIALLATVSNMFSLELVVFPIFAVTVAYVCTRGTDLLPIIPLFICSGLSISGNNNPGKNTASVFSMEKGGIVIICVGVLIVVSLIYCVIRNRKNYLKRKYALLSGMLILTAAYVLGGIGSNGYMSHGFKSIFFGLLNGIAIALPYLLFSGGVKWDKAPRDYLCWVGFSVGCLLLFEIGWIYLSKEIIRNGVIDRRSIYTGWGMYNNMGSILAMTIPFPFYLGTKYRKCWLGVLMSSLFMVGLIFTCSRASIICGTCVFFLCAVMMFRYTQNRKGSLIALGIFLGGLTLILLVFGETLLNLFRDLLSRGLDPSDRDKIYKDGFALFSKYPILGGSFFNQEYVPWGWATNEAFNGFIPPRWHNTIIQLLASCGIVGLGAYIVHRVQTVKLFLKDRRAETMFAACSLLVLLATSLFDCHFFNVGPVLFYSMVLAFVENTADK